MGPCCCTICKYKSSSAYKIFKHRIRKGSLTVSVERLGKLVALVKASLFLKGVQHIETANISQPVSLQLPQRPFLSPLFPCLPHLKGLFPYKHALSMTIYILCLQSLTFFRPPSHSSGFSGLSTSSIHGEQSIYGSRCCYSSPQIFTCCSSHHRVTPASPWVTPSPALLFILVPPKTLCEYNIPGKFLFSWRVSDVAITNVCSVHRVEILNNSII